MKRVLRIVLLLAVISGLGLAQDSRQYLGSIDLLGQVLPIGSKGISPGLALSTNAMLFPYLNMSLAFGGRYYSHFALAAAKDLKYEMPLTALQVGIGTDDLLKVGSIWFYDLGAKVRYFRSRHYENLVAAGTLMFGWEGPFFRLCGGLDLSVQRHQILDAEIFPLRDERVYEIAPKIAFYSRYGNILLTAGKGVFVAGLSLTLNTE